MNKISKKKKDQRKHAKNVMILKELKNLRFSRNFCHQKIFLPKNLNELLQQIDELK